MWVSRGLCGRNGLPGVVIRFLPRVMWMGAMRRVNQGEFTGTVHTG